MLVVGANPCVRSKWRRARRVEPSSGAIGLDRISELRERDLGVTHQTRSVVGVTTQEGADLVGRERGGTSVALGPRRMMQLVLSGRPD